MIIKVLNKTSDKILHVSFLFTVMVRNFHTVIVGMNAMVSLHRAKTASHKSLIPLSNKTWMHKFEYILDFL